MSSIVDTIASGQMGERRIRSAIAMRRVKIVEAVEANRATIPHIVVDCGAI